MNRFFLLTRSLSAKTTFAGRQKLVLGLQKSPKLRFPIASVRTRCFSSFPEYTPITMPALSPTMEDGSISTWIKKEGDEISAGEAICEIETDKATVDFELADGGFLAKILVGANTRVKVGDLIGILVEETADVSAFSESTLQDFAQNETKSTENASEEAPVAQEPVETTRKSVEKAEVAKHRVFISPFARKTAKEHGITVTQLEGLGTGPKGRIVYNDVQTFIAKQSTEKTETVSHNSSTEQTAAFTDLPLASSPLAQNLAKSKQEAPHYHLVSEVDITKLLETREIYRTSFNVDVSVNDFLILASTRAMKHVPIVNASFRGDFIRQFHSIDINLFMNNSLGLIANCQDKGLADFAEESAKLLDSEEEGGSLKLGTFSIVNLGSFGVSQVFPIVVHGQSACLGVGEVFEEFEPFEDDFKKTDRIKLTLSCDHRVVDGAVGAQWLQQMKKLLEDPLMLLL